MTIDIEDLKKVKLDKDDVIILKVTHDVHKNHKEKLNSDFKRVFPNNYIVIIEKESIEFEIIKKEQS